MKRQRVASAPDSDAGTFTRRGMMRGLVAALAPAFMARGMRAIAATQQLPPAGTAELGPYAAERLPPGIRSRFVNDVNGLRMHVLEAGFEERGRPAVLLLHGFPELAYSWRQVMLPIASA